MTTEATSPETIKFIEAHGEEMLIEQGNTEKRAVLLFPAKEEPEKNLEIVQKIAASIMAYDLLNNIKRHASEYENQEQLERLMGHFDMAMRDVTAGIENRQKMNQDSFGFGLFTSPLGIKCTKEDNSFKVSLHNDSNNIPGFTEPMDAYLYNALTIFPSEESLPKTESDFKALLEKAKNAEFK